ncbi:MAG TPA: DUF4912 domain-containing protein, partial [Bacillota bacterium]|nr:DUF4912 domain-containing protein [Bacillota bacterium]
MPPILLEGDEPPAPPVTGPGQKYALGPTPPVAPPKPPEGQLPEAYGTGRLFLTARDPHCLYAHWDIAAEQQRRYNALSVHQHLILRVYLETLTGRPLTELPVHPESTHWFIHVDRAGIRYAAELGYYQPDHHWRTIATAEPVMAPPETVAEEKTVQFATFHPEVPLARAAKPAREAAAQAAAPPPAPPSPPQMAPPPVPQAQAGLEPAPVRPTRVSAKAAVPAHSAETPPSLPPPQPEIDRQLAWRPTPVAGPSPAAWTPAQEQALAEVVSTTLVRQEWGGSAEITELIRRQAVQVRQVQEAISSIAAAQLGIPAPAPAAGISSPMGEAAEAAPAISSPLAGEAPARGRGFWFNVNAELIIYGATEPDATVSIGGRQIRLRPD